MKIDSPVATGNGAYIVHKMLENGLNGYQVNSYNPYLTLFPPALSMLKGSRNVDLVHAPPDYAPFFYKKEVPLVVTFHGYSLDNELNKYNSFFQNIHYKTDLNWFTKKGISLASQITCVSNYLSELVKADTGYKGDIRVIYNGVDEQRFVPKKKKNDYFDVVFSGNLIRKKGAELLPEIMKYLDKNIRIFYTSGLRTISREYQDKRLIPVGKLPYSSMHTLYQSADALLFPSVREGFGLAIAEAMSCGLPVVASNVSAIPELVDHEKGGYLCDISDAYGFAEALNTLASSNQVCCEMGQYNRDKVESLFTMRRMINDYKHLFDEVIESGGKY